MSDMPLIEVHEGTVTTHQPTPVAEPVLRSLSTLSPEVLSLMAQSGDPEAVSQAIREEAQRCGRMFASCQQAITDMTGRPLNCSVDGGLLASVFLRAFQWEQWGYAEHLPPEVGSSRQVLDTLQSVGLQGTTPQAARLCWAMLAAWLRVMLWRRAEDPDPDILVNREESSSADVLELLANLLWNHRDIAVQGAEEASLMEVHG